MSFPFDIIALSLLPCAALTVVAMMHLCEMKVTTHHSWRIPCAVTLVIALVGTLQAAVLNQAEPADLVTFGAFYSPDVLWHGLWRFATSVFLYDDGILALFNVITIAIVGTRVVANQSVAGFTLTFFISSAIGTALAASVDAQALLTGATAGTFGIVTASLSCGGYRISTGLERIARAVAIGYIAAVIARLSVNEEHLGLLLACAGAASGIVIRNTFSQTLRPLRFAGLTACLIAPFAIAAFISPSPNLLELARLARKTQNETWHRLAALEKARSRGWMSDGEFAHRLTDDVLKPLDQVIASSDRWSAVQTNWARSERDHLVLRHSQLSILAQLMLQKQRLVEAEAADVESRRATLLDAFWKSLPVAEGELVRLSSHDRLKETAGADLRILREIATDIEIWSAESAISELRERISSENQERGPASNQAWVIERELWQKRHARLSALDAASAKQEERLSAIKKRVEDTIAAIR